MKSAQRGEKSMKQDLFGPCSLSLSLSLSLSIVRAHVHVYEQIGVFTYAYLINLREYL